MRLKFSKPLNVALYKHDGIYVLFSTKAKKQ